MILKYYPQNRIILNQTVFHERYVEDNSILPFVSSRYKDAKLLIDRLEKQMVDKLPNLTSIIIWDYPNCILAQRYIFIS